MTTTVATPPMTGQEIVDLTKKHTLFEWSAQSKVDPIPVARAKGIYFWTPEGKRFIDFNSQLMSVNIGHGDERVIHAIHEQAQTLAYANPFMATEPRARLGAKLAEITPGDIDTFFFTNGGAEANENAIKIARFFTGRHKIMARYRSYHGATAGACRLPATRADGPRSPAFRVWCACSIRITASSADGIGRDFARDDRRDHATRGPHTIAAFILEPVVGTNGILIPPDGYLEGVRELCDKYGILMIADEVMAGFGRTGEWFAIDHWKVVPDLLCMAKGLTSSYLPLGAVGMRHHIAQHFQDKVFYGGLTYNSHPMGCAAALATIRVYEEDRLIENAKKMGVVMKQLGAEMQAKHPSVGAVRSIGLFGIFELVRNRKTRQPMAPFNGTSDEMASLGRFFREQGLYTLVRWNTFYTNPPLCINEQQLREAFAIIDKGLDITDKAVTD